ncbi:MAG TPA: histidinol-phosphate transaminase [Thermoanaerobaculaceae bacterium]|nr:histidinol-phosphate transaminase [Thermoanaerobaculaceae bacterium]HPS78806.1 histidinol-phosphate transaminase [Thermoanaerobaculaceae bacterium]
MTSTTITRRRFGVALGAAAGAALLEMPLGSPGAEASIPSGVPRDVLQLNSNENPYGPSPAAREAAVRSLDVAGRYPDAGEDELRSLIARTHGVSPDQILFGCGSGDIIRMAAAAFLGPGRKLVTAEPAFEAVLAYNRVTHAEVVKVPLDASFRHDLPRMAAACDAATGLVYVCNPNNPTGTVVTREELAAFLARVPGSATVLLDEAYIHFVQDPSASSGLDFLASRLNLVVLRTFSKVYGMAGLRLGYAVAASEKLDALARHASFSNVNSAVLAAALTSLADARRVAEMKRRLNDTRQWLAGQLAADGRRFIPSEANFLLLDTGRDVAPLIAAFQARQILVGRKISSMPSWLRVSVGTPAEMRRFVAVLRELVPAPAAG